MKPKFFQIAGGAFLLAASLVGTPIQAIAQNSNEANTLAPYVDPKQQTALWFGARSHWLQPWRAYMDTWPAARLRDSIGINLNVSPEEADATCRHLAKNGFKLARIEFGWGNLSWDDPTRLNNQDAFDTVVGACKRYGIRPLFLLNANSGVPCPLRFFDVYFTQPPKKGDRVIHVRPDVLPQLVKGRSGLNGLTDYWAAEDLFTDIQPDGTITLSKPLPKDLPADKAPAATLKYAPFYPMKRDAKTVPPELEATMQGWLEYVRAIVTHARRVLGTEGKSDAGFDVEVWNELTFGSHFLNRNEYYAAPIAEGEPPTAQILARTVAFLRDANNNFGFIGVNDGFNNQWPWGAGSTAPPGLTALGKHPYAGVKIFPDPHFTPNGSVPLNALGERDAVSEGQDKWRDTFTPSYVSLFPEYFLNPLQTEHLIRDVSPITTDLYGVKHGRETHPNNPDGTPAPAPTLWITEVNLDVNGADPGNLSDYIKGGHKPLAPGLTPADAEHIRAKAILRYLMASVNKGVGRIYFFAAKDDNPMGLGLMSASFFKSIDTNKGAYPTDDTLLTSPTMRAVRNLTQKLSGDVTAAQIRPLTLLSVTEPSPRVQFQGDPASAAQIPNPRPALYNRDVLGFFPFQSGPQHYIIPVYVMTRNLTQLYKPDAPATDATRFDMPPETFRLTINGPIRKVAKISLYDPINDKTYPVKILAHSQTLTLELALTDSPRLLLIE